ncbi:hypothetical protein KL918_004005 [Ogataea parapolymorpha]|nr:hypothetical protein KL918_004005 [Ogataea parapolymorpha]KAG7874830.1 hypothetical protein KL916_001074 [Ogataea parapolymorpha]
MLVERLCVLDNDNDLVADVGVVGWLLAKNLDALDKLCARVVHNPQHSFEEDHDEKMYLVQHFFDIFSDRHLCTTPTSSSNYVNAVSQTRNLLTAKYHSIIRTLIMESIRVDASIISQFTKKTVRVIGKLIDKSTGAGTAIVQCNGSIQLKFQNQQALLESLTLNNWYECIGIVDTDNSVKVIQIIDFGDQISEPAVTKLVEMSHKVPELFYTSLS